MKDMRCGSSQEVSTTDVSPYGDCIHYALVKGDVESVNDVKFVTYSDEIHDDLEAIAEEY